MSERRRSPGRDSERPQDAARDAALASLDWQSDSDDKDAAQGARVNAMSTPERFDGRAFRPPFEPGNSAALVHGGNSSRAVAAKAVQVHNELLTIAPYLAEDKFIPAVNRYLQAAAREALLDGHVQAVSAEKGPGAVSAKVWEQVTAAARLASKLGSDLGLDPLGHARIRALSIGAEATEASLSDLEARGRETLGFKRLQATEDSSDEGIDENGCA
jgi:hypothetical protein